MQAAASRLRVDVGEHIDDEDVDRVIAQATRHREALASAAEAFRAAGLDYGTVVDDEDIVRLADYLGISVGTRVDTADVRHVIHSVATRRSAQASPHPSRTDPAPAQGPTPRFAVVAGVNIRLPSRQPRLIGFHQASYRTALPMRPTGHPLDRILPSRGRPTPRSSAADVAVPANTTVLSPIRGRVVEVMPYQLYGKYPDVRIRMVSDPNPSLLVTILHVTDPVVRVGQWLEAGDPLARRATSFPFYSQIDGYTGGGPHVHIEAKRR